MKRLEVKNLEVSFGQKKVIDRISFEVRDGEVLGFVGESGSGKTLTAMSIMRLTPPSATVKGEILFAKDGQVIDLTKLSEDEMRKIRGRYISLVVQNPHSAFNPVVKVGIQVAEPLIIHYRERRSKALEKVRELFEVMGIADAPRKVRAYPFELSGGMKQRAVIATSIIANPRLLIADEPTTALDPTIQAQILKLLRNLVDERKLAMIFISHDIAVVGWISDRICVMYAGWIVEEGKTHEVLSKPAHPYTKALLESTPYRGKPKPIAGSPLDINKEGCRFAKRCPLAKDDCFSREPETIDVGGRKVKCFFPL